MQMTAIFWPMIAHALLVFAIYGLFLVRRRQAVKAGDATMAQFRENRDEPPQSLFVKNNLANQFELPVLFHVVCLALFVTGAAGVAALVLAWVFALSRYVHAVIHVTSNDIRLRQPAFSVGFLAVLLMWGLLAVHLLQI